MVNLMVLGVLEFLYVLCVTSRQELSNKVDLQEIISRVNQTHPPVGRSGVFVADANPPFAPHKRAPAGKRGASPQQGPRILISARRHRNNLKNALHAPLHFHLHLRVRSPMLSHSAFTPFL